MFKEVATAPARWWSGALVCLALNACGGGGGSASNPATFAIGGTVSGLKGTVVLQNNGTDNISLTAPGAFTFPSPISSGGAYAVTILTQPQGETCTVTASSGTVSANVNNVAVACAPTVFTVGGTFSGLVQPVVLQDNQGDNLTVTGNGTFTFPTAIQSGDTYAVTILTQANGQLCQVTSGSGTIGSTNITSVSVQCEATYTLGGTLSGLSGMVVLQNNGGNNLSLTANGSFAFAGGYPGGTAYAVTIATQPNGQTCTVMNGAGTIGASPVTNIVVSCVTLYSVGGTISRDSGTGNGQVWSCSTMGSMQRRSRPPRPHSP